MTIKPLQLAGRIIMENGGETYRVEETVTRMGRAFGLKKRGELCRAQRCVCQL